MNRCSGGCECWRGHDRHLGRPLGRVLHLLDAVRCVLARRRCTASGLTGAGADVGGAGGLRWLSALGEVPQLHQHGQTWQERDRAGPAQPARVPAQAVCFLVLLPCLPACLPACSLCPTPRECPWTTWWQWPCSPGLACRRCAGAEVAGVAMPRAARHTCAAAARACLLPRATSSAAPRCRLRQRAACRGSAQRPQGSRIWCACPLPCCSAATANEKAAEEKEEAEEAVSEFGTGEGPAARSWRAVLCCAVLCCARDTGVCERRRRWRPSLARVSARGEGGTRGPSSLPCCAGRGRAGQAWRGARRAPAHTAAQSANRRRPVDRPCRLQAPPRCRSPPPPLPHLTGLRPAPNLAPSVRPPHPYRRRRPVPCGLHLCPGLCRRVGRQVLPGHDCTGGRLLACWCARRPAVHARPPQPTGSAPCCPLRPVAPCTRPPPPPGPAPQA